MTGGPTVIPRSGPPSVVRPWKTCVVPVKTTSEIARPSHITCLCFHSTGGLTFVNRAAEQVFEKVIEYLRGVPRRFGCRGF